MSSPEIKGPRHIFWDGRWGMASYRGVHVELDAAPCIPGLSIEQIDYAPNVGQRMLIEHGGSWHAASLDEGRAIDEVLELMMGCAKAALGIKVKP